MVASEIPANKFFLAGNQNKLLTIIPESSTIPDLQYCTVIIFVVEIKYTKFFIALIMIPQNVIIYFRAK